MQEDNKTLAGKTIVQECEDTAFLKDVGTPAFTPVTMDEDVNPERYWMTESDLIILISEVKIMVYGIPGSEQFPGLSHESCGVDSYSLSARAKDCMAEENYKESEHIGDIADVLALDIIFVTELARYKDLATTYESVFLAVKDLHEAYLIDSSDGSEPDESGA